MTNDKYSNSLLIACKGSTFVDPGNRYEGYKAKYRVDLEKMFFTFREPVHFK